MCKKNKAGGCNCCCKPILERVDEFNSRWPCWRDVPGSLAASVTIPISPRFDFSTSGKLIRRDVSSDSLSEFRRGIGAPAVLWAIPFSMEMIIEFDSIYDDGSVSVELDFSNWNAFGGTGFRQWVRLQRKTTSGLGFGALDSNAAAGSYFTYTNSGALKVHMKVQYDTDGMTNWIWFNDTQPSWLTPGYTHGVKGFFTMPTMVASSSSWAMSHVSKRSFPDDLYTINRMEIRKWNHVTDGPRPDPENPF